MSDINAGDYVLISNEDVNGNDVVELVLEITEGRKLIPDGWIVTDFGIYPPERVRPYSGAKSFIK